MKKLLLVCFALMVVTGFATSPADATCTITGNLQASCLPADFTFPNPTDPNTIRAYMWSRCDGVGAVAPTAAMGKYDAAVGLGVDQGALTRCQGTGNGLSNLACSGSRADGFFDHTSNNCTTTTGVFRLCAGSWNAAAFDNCPNAGPCGGPTTLANTDTVVMLTNGAVAASTTAGAMFSIGAIRYNNGGTTEYDIDSISGTGTTGACSGSNTCYFTNNGGSTWTDCGAGGLTITAWNTPQPTIVATNSVSRLVQLTWSHPTIFANGSNVAYPITSWSIYRADAAATPTTAFASWTEIARYPGNVATTGAIGSGTEINYAAALPVNAYWFAILPNFDGSGGLLNPGVPCHVGALTTPAEACPAMPTNVWTVAANTASLGTPKTGIASAQAIVPTSSTGSFVDTAASYESLQKITISFTTTDEQNVTGFNVFRGAGASPVTWTKLTASPLAAKGMPSTYSFTDTTLPRQRTFGAFTYRVEALDGSGQALFEIRVPVSK